MILQGNSKQIVNFAVLSVFIFTILLLIPGTLALLKGGFEDPSILAQFQFYQNWGIGFFIGLVLIFIIELIIVHKDSEFGNSLGFSSPGDKPSLGIFRRFSVFQLFLLSLIFFLIIGLVNTTYFSQTAFGSPSYTGVAFLPQQFSAGDSILFSTLLVPAAENNGAAFVIALSLLGLRTLGRKFNWKTGIFLVFVFALIPIVLGLFGIAWHSSVYPGSEIQLTTVFFFWLIGGLLTLLTGTFVVFLSQHAVNNLYVDISRFLSSEIILLIFLGVIVSLIIIYVIIYRGRIFGRKNYEKEQNTAQYSSK